MKETLDDTSLHRGEVTLAGAPGAVLLWSEERPLCVPFALHQGALRLGREELQSAGLADGRVSRGHLRLERDAEGWRCTDEGSRNGTWVDGERCVGSVRRAQPPVLRVGHTLLLAVEDIGRFAPPGVCREGGLVVGPSLRAALARVEALARAGSPVLLQGPSGAGKELAAQRYHAAFGADAGPLVSVNCATLPRDLAERLLFGARRGAYTGATDAAGLVQQAHGGTLFLDEVAELEAPVQAKLLRVLETGQVLPLGATSPVAVRFRLVAATLRDLREAAAQGRFREDLYFRLGRPAVALPPLSARREELGLHLEDALRSLGERAPRARAGFVEACLLRPWPGNVRELRHEVRAAAAAALALGRDVLEAADLDPEAGMPLEQREGPAEDADEEKSGESPRAPSVPTPSEELVREVLSREGGNVSRAARALGLSRARLRRLLERLGEGSR